MQKDNGRGELQEEIKSCVSRKRARRHEMVEIYSLVVQNERGMCPCMQCRFGFIGGRMKNHRVESNGAVGGTRMECMDFRHCSLIK